tara:strand:+ start:329 stop:685 length:357 start_codon:yes stop_codon:yes gene_type:complete
MAIGRTQMGTQLQGSRKMKDKNMADMMRKGPKSRPRRGPNRDMERLEMEADQMMSAKTKPSYKKDAEDMRGSMGGMPKMKKGGGVKKMMGGGMTKAYKSGGKVRGYGMARGGKACKMR